MISLLEDVTRALSETVEGVGPSLVRVEARRRMPASGIVWSKDGLVVTAHHVVEADEGIVVGTADGRSLEATLVGRDPTTDLALLRVESADLAPARGRAPDDLRVGHLVLAMGRPGRSAQATMGIVSALGEAWQTPMGGSVDRFLQTDVVMAPGFSGGPLVDAAGEVIGMNTAGLLRGISLAVPLPTIERVVNALQAHGRIRRGYLGIGAQPVRLPEALAAAEGQASGLVLLSVEPGGPADRAGFLLGDVLIAFDDQRVERMDDLLASLVGDRVGQSVRVRIVRGGKIEERSITVGDRPERGG